LRFFSLRTLREKLAGRNDLRNKSQEPRNKTKDNRKEIKDKKVIRIQLEKQSTSAAFAFFFFAPSAWKIGWKKRSKKQEPRSKKQDKR
jgi:hypothetical protein